MPPTPHPLTSPLIMAAYTVCRRVYKAAMRCIEQKESFGLALCDCKRAVGFTVFVWYRKPYSSMLLAQEFKQKEAQVFLARARYKCEGVKRGGSVRQTQGHGERSRATERSQNDHGEGKKWKLIDRKKE